MTARLPDGREPRGLLPNGMVRTTGWLRVGRVPVSTGVWPALAAALGTLPSGVPWLPFPCAAAGFALWQVWIRYVQPTSSAVNLDSVPALELRPDDWFRPYGVIGPAAPVLDVESAPADHLRSTNRGGRVL